MRVFLLLTAALAVASVAHAQDSARKADDPQSDPSATPQLTYTVDVTAVAPRTAASSSMLRSELFSHLFVESPADVLRAVPGLVIAQHAGGGKADQYLIRGFDADHGTDVHLAVDGVPVNLVSHAHGQGYADLHFVIPETIERIDVHKGPYYAEFGDLATAGAVQLSTRDRFDRSFVKFQGGSFDTGRVAFGFSPAASERPGWIAGEAIVTNGPYRHPQDFTRLNVAGKWKTPIKEAHALTMSTSLYRGQWNASGQIPARLVDAGALDRFDAVDRSEGGDTSRAQASLLYAGRLGKTSLMAHSYIVNYALDLFSNFTFFARDQQAGDGILQRDRRTFWGGRVQAVRPHRVGGIDAVGTVGSEWRRDGIDVGLAYQQQRQPTGTVVDSRVAERDVGLYAQEEFVFGARVRAIAGVRHERFAFDVQARGHGPTGSLSPSWTGPKASLIVAPRANRELELFANYGRGFHSNDARAAVSGPSATVLPAANGFELGVRREFRRRFEVSAAWWLLDLESEFTWVGDEGTTEAGGDTRRHGAELEARWRIASPVWAEFDVTTSRGRYRGTDDAIARAPRLTMNAAIVLTEWNGWSGQMGPRHVGDHPAVEDRSVEARGFTLVDLHLRRQVTKNVDALVSLENLFDADDREAQTFFASRLRHESVPVNDVHFTPGNPRAIRLGLEYRFDWR